MTSSTSCRLMSTVPWYSLAFRLRCAIQYAPLFGRYAERVRQALENDVSKLCGPIAVPSQSGE
jgi:hypothetical protein